MAPHIRQASMPNELQHPCRSSSCSPETPRTMGLTCCPCRLSPQPHPPRQARPPVLVAAVLEVHRGQPAGRVVGVLAGQDLLRGVNWRPNRLPQRPACAALQLVGAGCVRSSGEGPSTCCSGPHSAARSKRTPPQKRFPSTALHQAGLPTARQEQKPGRASRSLSAASAAFCVAGSWLSAERRQSNTAGRSCGPRAAMAGGRAAGKRGGALGERRRRWQRWRRRFRSAPAALLLAPACLPDHGDRPATAPACPGRPGGCRRAKTGGRGDPRPWQVNGCEVCTQQGRDRQSSAAVKRLDCRIYRAGRAMHGRRGGALQAIPQHLLDRLAARCNRQHLHTSRCRHHSLG